MKKLARKIDLHYVAIQGTFGLGFGALISFGAVLMLSRGLSNSALGVVTCIAQLLPMVLQPAATAFAAKKGITPRRMILLSSALVVAVAVVMLLLSHTLWAIILGYVAIFVLFHFIIPYHNILMVDFLVRGVEVNYGLGRGVGSGTFALSTLVLGFVLEGRDAALIVPVIAASVLLQMLCTYTFRYPLPEVAVSEANGQEQEQEMGRMAILRSRPDFALMLLAAALLLGVHNVTNVYMVHVINRVGGAERLMGIILGVSAFMELLSMPLFPKLRRLLGIKTVMRLSALFFIVRLVMLLTAKNEAMLYIAALSQFFQSGLMLPSIVYYVAGTLPKAQQTGGQSMMHLAGNCLGPALITLAAGPMVDWRGINAALWLLIVLAAVGTVAVVISTAARKEK